MKVLIIGGGTAGITVAAQLKNKIAKLEVQIFEPSEYHYYQPLYTLVGAGVDKKEKTKKLTKDYIPNGVDWVKQKIASIDPQNNSVKDDLGKIYRYDFLVVAPGIQLDWHLVEGLKETLGKNGVCSVYGYQESEDTFKTLENFKGGKIVFTAGSTPVKCGGASQKIMYLSEAYLRKTGIREKSQVIFASAGTTIFGVPGFKEALQKIIKERNIETRFFHDLIKVDGANKKATFSVKTFNGDNLLSTEEKEIGFEMLHVVPPQSAPDFIKKSILSVQEGGLKGWLDVNRFTLQHNTFSNIFGLGDVCGLPTAKTGAAVRKQAPVVTNNILRLINKQNIDTKLTYDGYSACPILTDYNHVLMAEFIYGNKPKSSFFFDTTKPRWSMYLLKHYVLPWIYWKLMLRGKS